jgi:hypothetical protein
MPWFIVTKISRLAALTLFGSDSSAQVWRNSGNRFGSWISRHSLLSQKRPGGRRTRPRLASWEI